MATIDPRLTKAIKDAKKGGGSASGNVRAVVTLRSADPSQPLDPQEATHSVNQIVAKMAKRFRREPRDVVIFPYIQSFSIDADARMIDGILDEESVDAASLKI